MKTMAKIVVVGSFVMDNVVTMERFPEAGESVIGENMRAYPGGKGINQCIAARRLGAETVMVGMLGDDGAGTIFRNLLEEEGVDARCVFTAKEPTGAAQVQINKYSQNRICVIPGANYCFKPEHLKLAESIIAQAQMVIAQLEMKMETIYSLIDVCDTLGVPLMLNPAPAQPIAKEYYSKIDFLTPNESELALLSGMPAETDGQIIEACEALLNKGVKNVVATLGKRGAYALNAEGGGFVEGYNVKAIDTVAAGDSFNAALAVMVTEGRPLMDAVRFANAMGALTVQVKGAIPSLHTREQVLKFIDKNK